MLEQYVRTLMPKDFIDRRDDKDKTPWMIFLEEHEELEKESKEWLKDSSTAYTVASTIVTSVTFGACFQGPGGNDSKGKPLLRGDLAFDTYALAVLFAFSFSITALAAFLAVYSSQKRPKQYLKDLPLQLLFGLASLFVSMFSTLVAFYAAHSYEVNHGEMRKVHLPLYAITLVPACFYLATQIPLFRNLLKYSLSRVPPPPKRSRDDDLPTTTMTETPSPTPETPSAKEKKNPETSVAGKEKTPETPSKEEKNLETSMAEKEKTPETQSQPQPQAILPDVKDLHPINFKFPLKFKSKGRQREKM